MIESAAVSQKLTATRPRSVALRRGWLAPTAVWLILILFLAFCVLPYIWMLITSFKSESQAASLPIRVVPAPFSFQNYLDVLGIGAGSVGIPAGAALGNTVVVAMGSTLLAMIIGLPAAYSFAKYRVPMGRTLLFLVLTTRMFPVVALAIPLYQIVRALGLYDTKLGLILAYTALTLPFTIWVMYMFFRDVHPSLEEAARLDGCNFFQMFVGVILPVALPGVVAAFLLSLVYPWNDLLLSSILTASPASQTLPAALAQFNTGTQLYWAHMSAASVVATVPILVLTLALQRYIVRGLTVGAVKD